jgi:hypothetical protein
MVLLSRIWGVLQGVLFPHLEEQVGPLSSKEQELIKIIGLLELPKYIGAFEWKGAGRKRKRRLAVAYAFVAKAVYNLATTKLLIELLRSSQSLRTICGFETRDHVPSEATFSRAFAEFSKHQILNDVLKNLIETHLGDRLVGHISRDSTAVEVREKPCIKQPQSNAGKSGKRGRPKKGQESPPASPKRLDIQPQRSLAENIAELPTQCDKGTKKNSQGYKISWNGYKLHLDCVDGDIPISAILTSASLHDSQAAIPLAQMSFGRVTSLYDLMDAAYDAEQIHEFSRQLNHVPLIDHNPRRGEKKFMDPAALNRFGARSGVERVNGYLKDNFGGSQVRVKGAQKVMTHLMFGVVAIAAQQIWHMFLQ